MPPLWRSSKSDLQPPSISEVCRIASFFRTLKAARCKGGMLQGSGALVPAHLPHPPVKRREGAEASCPSLFCSATHPPGHANLQAHPAEGGGFTPAGRGTGDSSPALPCWAPPHCPQRGRGRPRRDGPRPTLGDAGSLRGRPCCPPTGLDLDGDHPQATKHCGRAGVLTVICGMLFFP